MSKSRVMKQESAVSPGINAYSLQQVRSTRPLTLPGSGDIGGSGAEAERDAYLRGFSTGEQAGIEKGLKEIEARYQFLTEWVRKLKSTEERLMKRVEEDLIRLSLSVAEKILRDEIQKDPKKLGLFIREALEKLNSSDHFVIRLHPADHATFSGTGAVTIREMAGLKSIRLQPDASLKPGDCMIETGERLVDGRIGSQLALFKDAFLGREE